MSNASKVAVRPGARLLEYDDGRASILNPSSKSRFSLSRTQHQVIQTLNEPLPLSELLSRAAARGGSTVECAAAVAALAEAGIVVEWPASPIDGLADRIAKLRGAMWHEPGAYLAASVDFPGIDYGTEAGWNQDETRMQALGRKSAPPALTLTAPRGVEVASLAELQTAYGPKRKLALDLGRFESCIRCAFKVVRKKRPSRTSPSGGARHPTECFVLLGHRKMLAYYNWYEDVFRVDPTESAEKERVWEEAPLATVYLGSRVERNMYRYRESRTFRTIHMDVGHILYVLLGELAHAGFRAKLSVLPGAELQRLTSVSDLMLATLAKVSVYVD